MLQLVVVVFHPHFKKCLIPRHLGVSRTALCPSAVRPGGQQGRRRGEREARGAPGGTVGSPVHPLAAAARARPGRCWPLAWPLSRARASCRGAGARPSPGAVAGGGKRPRNPLEIGPWVPRGLHRCKTDIGPVPGAGGRWPRFPSGGGAAGGGPQPGCRGSARPCRPRRGKMAAAAQALSGSGLLLAAAALALLAVAIGTDSWYETDARRHRERCRGFGHKRNDPPGSMSAPSSHLPLRARPPRALLPGRPPAPAPAAAAAALDSHCGRRFNSTVSGLWRRCHRAGYEPDSEELIRKGAAAARGAGAAAGDAGGPGPAAVRGAERGCWSGPAGAAGGAAAAA